MKKRQLDVAIIGGGTAGMTALSSALKQTDNVAMIEGAQFGTTCARVGCMPSKLMIAAAEAAHQYQNASQFGVHYNSKPEINGQEVMRRVQSERDRFVGFVLDSINNRDESKLIRGNARFKTPNILLIDDDLEITAKSIVIATGSTPIIPPIFQDFESRLLTNENIFEMKDLPKSVAVIGSGIIALELGQSLHRLGVKVTIFARSGRIGTITDPVVQTCASKILSEELRIINQTKILKLNHHEEGVVIQFSGNQVETQTEIYEKILVASGREPNLKNLDLKNSQLDLDEKGVPLYNPETAQCGNTHIFLAGDANNDKPLLHEASDEGFIAGANAGRYPEVISGKRRSTLEVIFSDPEVAIVGQSFSDLDPDKFETGEVSFENQGRSRVMLINKGILRLYADRNSKQFLGAEMIAPRAEHLAHLLAWSHQQRMTIPQMLEMPFYHPVIEEGLRTGLRDVNEKLR